MKTTILSLVSFLALGFAGIAHAGEGAARRGQVNVQAAATKAVVAGPAVIKVYSGFSGAKVFVADAASATDADCVAAAGRVSGTALRLTRSSSSPWVRVRSPASPARASGSSCSGTRSRPRRRPRCSRSDNGRRAAAGGLRPRSQSARMKIRLSHSRAAASRARRLFSACGGPRCVRRRLPSPRRSRAPVRPGR